MYKIIESAFLICGTCIGGGMLALPASAARLGFWPTILIMTICWIFMSLTGLMFLESTLWNEKQCPNSGKETNVLGLTRKYMGQNWSRLCWVVFVFVSFGSIVAYVSELVGILGANIPVFASNHPWVLTAGTTAVLFLLLSMHKNSLAKINSILVSMLACVYLALIYLISPSVELSYFSSINTNDSFIFSLIPLLLTSFSYPGLVPLIVKNLDYNPKNSTISVILGTSLTFLVYLLWLFVIFGSFGYEGAETLQKVYSSGHSFVREVADLTGDIRIQGLMQTFGLVAIVTSFLGVSLGLFHFLADGMNISLNRIGTLKLALLVGGATLLAISFFEDVFYSALEVTGGLGDAVINGVIPVLIMVVGLFQLSNKPYLRFFHSKVLLAGMLLFSAAVILMEIVEIVVF